MLRTSGILETGAGLVGEGGFGGEGYRGSRALFGESVACGASGVAGLGISTDAVGAICEKSRDALLF